MFGLLKKKFGAGKAELKKVENRDLMEAIIGGALLVAAADGEIEEAELISLEKQILANPALEHFGAEIGKTINRFEQMLNAGFRLGKMKILREIEDIKTNSADAEEVFVNMLTIAESDGEIEPKEMAILKEVGNHLNIRLSEYGLQ
jgi:tellurite resistance protein TerB